MGEKFDFGVSKSNGGILNSDEGVSFLDGGILFLYNYILGGDDGVLVSSYGAS